jgi:type IV secretory pathway VirJ component
MRSFVLQALLVCIAVSPPLARVDTLRYGRFGTVRLYVPKEKPHNVVLFLSGDGGWNLGVIEMARQLSTLDAVVAGIDIIHYIRASEATPEKCWYPAADLEMLGKVVQKRLGFALYTAPVLVGYSSGATLTYTVLAQAPPATFRGGISLGFCPDLTLSKPLCRGSGLDWQPGPKKNIDIFKPDSKLETPWVVLHGEIDKVCEPSMAQEFVTKTGHGRLVLLPKVGHGFSVERNWMPQFKEAFASMVAARSTSEPPQATDAAISDLPLVEVTGVQSSSDCMVIHYTGDGGWGVTDKGLSEAFVNHGIPVAALNSLKYFWNRRTPEGTASDLARIMKHYTDAWHKKKVILVGYSFGADVMAFMINRLPLELLPLIDLVVLLGPSPTVDFEFHFTDWLGGSPKDGLKVLPEILKLPKMRMLVFYGSDEDESLAPEIRKLGLYDVVELPGGHRIGKNFEPVAKEILEKIGR